LIAPVRGVVKKSVSIFEQPAKHEPAFSRREAPELCEDFPPKEGVGNAGCPRTRSRACSVVSTRVSHHEYAGNTRHSRTMVLTVSSALPGDEFVLSPSSSDMACLSPVGPTRLRQLSTSNGCQDHTALPYATASVVCAPFDRSRTEARPATTHAPDAAASTASRPASMTMANAPLGDGTAGDIDLSRVGRKQNYF
jgi:hypothetical protein